MRYEIINNMDKYYKKIEAMYHQGYTVENIQHACPGLSKLETLDAMQKIYAYGIRKGRGLSPSFYFSSSTLLLLFLYF